MIKALHYFIRRKTMMKKLAKLTALLAVAALLFGAVGCSDDDDDDIAVTGVTLDKETASIKVDEKVTLTATVAPADATNKTVTWSSSDESKATVKDGVVTGVAAGTATITVTTEDGSKTAVCEVTVTTGTVIGDPVTATWDFSTSPEGFPTNDSKEDAISDFPLAPADGSGAKLTATGRWKYNDSLQPQATSNVTVADAASWLERDEKHLTLTLEGDATVTISYAGAGGIGPKRFVAVLDANNVVLFGTPADGIDSKVTLDKELSLTKGTYAIALNGARIFAIKCASAK